MALSSLYFPYVFVEIHFYHLEKLFSDFFSFLFYANCVTSNMSGGTVDKLPSEAAAGINSYREIRVNKASNILTKLGSHKLMYANNDAEQSIKTYTCSNAPPIDICSPND